MKNIIFDLGNVLLPIDFNAPVLAFKELGLKDFDLIYGKMAQSNLFDLLETGKISESAFRNDMREMANVNWSDDEIDDAWSSILLDFRRTTVEMLLKLAGSYRLFLLSNTNIIHYKRYDRKLRRELHPEGLSSLFEKAYYSHEVGFRKPDKEIFSYLLNDAGIKASDSLFIDDNEDNIKTAAEMGFKVHHLLSEEKVEELFVFDNKTIEL